MDPIATLEEALSGASSRARSDYNRWVDNGGFKVVVKVRPNTLTWKRGIRSVTVDQVGITHINGTHPTTKEKVRLPLAAVEVERW